MAKSSKKVSDVPPSESVSVAPTDGATQTNGTTKPAKQTKTKAATRKTKKTAPGAKGPEKLPRPASGSVPSARKPRSRKEGTEAESFTDDDIRMRAYFISERRTREGIPGNSAEDWLEARRQLQAEVDRRP